MSASPVRTSRPPSASGIGTALAALAHRTARPKHALQLVLYSGLLAGALFLLAAWVVADAQSRPIAYPGEIRFSWDTIALADVFALFLLGGGLFVFAPAAVAASIGAERKNGTLDQLRTTPVPPLGLLLGLVLGAPLRLTLLLVGPLGLHVLAALTGRVPPVAFVASVLVLLVGGVAAAMVGAMVALAPQRDSGGALPAVATAAVLGVSGFIAAAMATGAEPVRWAFIHPAGALNAVMISFDGFWREVSLSPWNFESRLAHGYFEQLATTPLWAVLFSGAVAVVGAHAGCRKLAAPHLPLLGRGSSLALFTLVAASIVLPIEVRWTGSNEWAAIGACLVMLLLLPVALVLGLATTPSWEAWTLGLRRPRGTQAGIPLSAPSPSVALWGMLAVALVLLAWRLPLAADDHRRHFIGLVWAAALFATAPLYLLFAATRFQTTGPRVGFYVGTTVHLVFQCIGVGLSMGNSTHGVESTVLHVAIVVGLAYPLTIAILQRRLAARVLTSARA